ncbi:MAG: hypothetical protein MZV64_16475 [Ignavibacteriales bacterium]|nr:hypothetical protein [Ignavibacteriales bacterium]
MLADWIDSVYIDELGFSMTDPWELRHRYVDVMNRQLSLSSLVGQITDKAVDDNGLGKIDLLLRAQYERQAHVHILRILL